MYSILADHTSGQIFLKTAIKPAAVRLRWDKLVISITLNAIG
jgi:hypothetical protein